MTFIEEKTKKVRGFEQFVMSIPTQILSGLPRNGEGEDFWIKNIEVPTSGDEVFNLCEFSHKTGKTIGSFFEIFKNGDNYPVFRYLWSRDMRCVLVLHKKYTKTKLHECEGTPNLIW